MRIVHKVCTHLLYHDHFILDRDGEPPKCKECPATEKSAHGPVTRGCRIGAEEFVKIVKTGNPWGKKGATFPRACPEECFKSDLPNP